MYDKVKACPCCGKIDSVRILTEFRYNAPMYRVSCKLEEKGCGLKTAWFFTINEAIEAWNRREGK